MRTIAVVLALAVSTIVLAPATPSFATKMNGKCCQSSDGGRSHRARVVLARRAIPHTCSAYAASCMRVSLRRGREDAVPMCQAAKAQCLQTGVHVGPYSGVQFAGMEKR